MLRSCATILFILSLCVCTPQHGRSIEYDRELFVHWIDEDNDGKNSREEALVNQSITAVFGKKNGSDIVITGGTWVCPYTGKIILDPSEVDADHIVPLKWAWDHGAFTWSAKKRQDFANDPDNILIVCKRANRSKGARGPIEWIPANLGYSSTYISKFMYICDKYNLAYEKAAFTEMLDTLKVYLIGIKLNTIQLERQ